MIKQHITSDQVVTPYAATLRLPHRAGERPATTSTNPHSQLDQRPDPTAVRNVIAAAVNLPGVEARPSMRAQAGTIGLYLKPKAARGGEEAFLLGREFAHVHPLPDGSLHLTLPADVRKEALAKGWAESHPLAGQPTISPFTVMVYAPRDAAEAETVSHLVRVSWEFATGARA